MLLLLLLLLLLLFIVVTMVGTEGMVVTMVGTGGIVAVTVIAIAAYYGKKTVVLDLRKKTNMGKS